MSKKSVLGKGIGALLSDAEIGKPVHRPPLKTGIELEIAKINANPNQPRTKFDAEALEELAESIKHLGVIQPITVREVGHESFQIISGERRFRAAQIAGLDTVPAYVRTVNDVDMLTMALVENVQREDLDAIEIATSYQQLIEECKLTQEKLSQRVGKKRTTITNYLRLLKLPAEIQLGLRQSHLSMGHARALITIDDPISQLKLYRAILEKDLSVRKTEEEVRTLQEKHPEKSQKLKTNRDLPHTEAQLKNHLINKLGWAADIKTGSKGDGKIVISYHNELELQEIIQKFNSLDE